MMNYQKFLNMLFLAARIIYRQNKTPYFPEREENRQQLEVSLTFFCLGRFGIVRDKNAHGFYYKYHNFVAIHSMMQMQLRNMF